MPIQRRLAHDQNEAAAQQAASWLQELPPHADVLLLLSSRNPVGYWYTCRLVYYVAPRRLSKAWNAVPAGTHWDYILAFRAARRLLPPGWVPWKRSETLVLAVPTARLAALAALPHAPAVSPAPRFPFGLRLVAGLFSLGVVVLLGALLLGLTLRAPPFRAWAANLALAHLTGAAALTWLLMIGLLIRGNLVTWPVYVALLCLLPTWRRARACLFPPSDAAQQDAKPLTRWEWALLLGIGLGILTAVERGLLIGLDWDGFMIWQLKAKAFFLDGNVSLLHDPAHFPYAHLDYPLLVPLQTWWAYRHFGAVSDRWAQLSGLLFYADTLLIFAAAARRYLARRYALAGVALLACLPEVTMHAVSGYADLPLAAYFLALGVCLMRLLVERDDALTPLIAWLLAGTVLTKNEGLLACVAVLTTATYYMLRSREARLPNGKRLLVWLGAAVAAYLPWFLMKRAWHLVNDIMELARPLHLTASLLVWRVGYTLWRGIVFQLGRVGPWFPAWGLVGVLFLVGGIVSWRRRIALCGPLWLLAGVQWLGYVGIYLITPVSLTAHIGSSAERLILHVVPVLLLASLLGCFAPAVREGRLREGCAEGGAA